MPVLKIHPLGFKGLLFCQDIGSIWQILRYPEEMCIRDRSMTEEEQLELLSTDGMLVKRPILVSEDFVLVGFKESEWSETLG